MGYKRPVSSGVCVILIRYLRSVVPDFLFFFFQAEDGIRDLTVTGVQTCALPICAPQQPVYVWFDPLITYLSATGFPDPGFERLWPADLHVIGKGITRFHCVIWPAMLLAAELPPPHAVWAHGYVQRPGAKMSKTAGAAVSLSEAIDYHGADAP